MTRAPRSQVLSAIGAAALVLAVAACSGSSGPKAAGTTTSGAAGGSSTTTAAASAPPVANGPSPAGLTPFTGMGPDAVGQETLALADGRRVVVWYPADPAKAKGTPTETFDIASLLSPAFQAKIPASERPPFAIDDHPGATADTAHGPYPVVLFSHGYAGFPEQSATLTTHIASWGFIVAAPDHVERSLSGLLGTAAHGVPHRTDGQVLQSTLALVRAEDQRSASPIHGLVKPGKVAVIGHSAGAGAAYELAAADPKDIASFISYAVGESAGQAVPTQPGMVMTGTTDGVIPPSADRAVYAGMHTPKWFVQIAGAGHLVFSDICLIGRSGGGIVAIGKRLGLPIDQFEKLGTDGCKAGDTDPVKAFPAIDDLSVDFLRWTLGVEAKPSGLDTAGLGSHFPTAKITVTSQR